MSPFRSLRRRAALAGTAALTLSLLVGQPAQAADLNPCADLDLSQVEECYSDGSCYGYRAVGTEQRMCGGQLHTYTVWQRYRTR